MRKSYAFAIATMLGLAFGGVACAASIAEVCKKAEGEPPLMWYSSQDPALNELTIKAFRTSYPVIQASSFRLASGALATRYSSERSAGVINADIVSLVDPEFVKTGRTKGWFVSFDQNELPELGQLDRKYFDSGIALTGINVYGITYNTDLVKGAPPKDWPDLLKPEYKGKIAFADPRSIPGFLDLMRILKIQYGDEFLRSLAKQQMVLVASAVPGTQQMAAGEFAIVFPNTMAVSEPVKLKGGPIDVVIPPVTTGGEYVTMISAGADSPNAAKCFYNFLYTNQGQTAFNGNTGVSPIFDMAKLPAGYKPLDAFAANEVRDELAKLLDLR